MRVAFVSMETTRHRDTDGTRRVERVARHLADRGHDVTIFCAQWWDGYEETITRDHVDYRAVTVSPTVPSFATRLPVLLALGLIGWTGIPLDVATMTIAAIVLGLVVDDTVHLLHRYVTAYGASSPVAAFRTSARQAGPRMAITTSVLAGGFLVLCLAQVKSIVWFGLLSSMAIAAAHAADLLALPAVVVGLHGRGDK